MPPEETCAALNGSEFIFFGDTRARQVDPRKDSGGGMNKEN